MCLTSPKHEICRLLVLKHQPHCFYILRCISPITPSIEISNKQLLLTARDYSCYAARDLSGNERLPSSRGLMVEHDAVRSEEAVTFPIVPRHPVGVYFGRAVGTSWGKGRQLGLWRRSVAE